MSLLANQTNINKDSAFFLLANMSSLNANGISTGQITTSSITATTANISSLTAANGNFSSIFTDYLSSGIADITDITTSTIFATAGVFINGAELTTVGGTELLLNGIPLATTSNLSTVADWALDPAISSVNMNAFDLLNTNLVSTVNLRAASAFIQNLLAWNILAVSSFTSTISSVSIQADELFVSSVKGDTGIFDNYLQTSSISSGNILASQIQTSTIKDISQASFIEFNGGDIKINSGVGGAGIFLTPTDEVAIQDPVTGQTYGLLASYVRGVSSISDVSTINNIPYPPPGTGSTISTFQTITVTDYISTPDIRVSSINGAELNGNTIIISTINTQSVSTNELQVNLTAVSSIQLKPSVGFNPSLSIDMGLGSLFTNVAGAALGGMNMIVGGIALATGVTAIYQGRQTKTVNLSTFELVNGTTQLQISTLGLDVSTTTRFVSSANANTPGEEFFISTIIPAGTPLIRSFSDPMNTISSPASSIQAFGQWVALPEGNISSLEFSTIICSSIVTAEGISTNGLSAQFVIGEQLISTPQLFVSSINNNVYPPPQQIVSTFPGSIYVADSIFATNLVSTFNILAGNIISTNGLSAQYVIGEQLVSTPQLFTSTINGASITPSTLRISSIQANSVSTGTTTAATLNATTISSATATISSITAVSVAAPTLSTTNVRTTNINSIPASGYRTVTDYSSRVIWSSISTTFQTVASTTLTTLTTGLINVNWNASLLSADNAKRNCQMYIILNGISSPVSYTTVEGIGHYNNASAGFATSGVVGVGTYIVQGVMNCDTNGVATVVGSWLTATGNLAQG